MSNHIEESFRELAKNRHNFNIRDTQVDLATKIYDFLDYKVRQNTSATSWADTSTDTNALVIEAGTGTGKSLGYLVPALKHNIKVIISTNTKALQKQVAQEIKSLTKLFPGVKYKVLEGASNYACRLKAGKADYASIHNWIADQRVRGTGMVHDFKDKKGNFRKELWDLIATDSNLCEKQCEHFRDCFFQKAREDARDADILILNHDLLLLNFMLDSEIFNTFQAIVIDEAHHLPEKARKVFTKTLGDQTIVKHISSLNTKMVDVYRCPQAYITEQKYADLQEKLFSYYPCDEAQSLQVSTFQEGFLDAVKELRTTLLGDANWLRHMSKDISPEGSDKSLYSLISQDIKRLSERAEMLEEMFINEDDNRYMVYTVEARKNKFIQRFESTPLDISKCLKDLYGKRPVVMLSATLRSGKSFDFYRQQIGQSDASAFCYPSPFAQNNTKIFIPSDPIEPDNYKGEKRDTYIATLANHVTQLHQRMQGRSLFLFTNKTDLDEVMSVLDSEIREQIFVQTHTSEIPAMVRAIKTSDNLSLAGLNAMWEGIDIVGKSLSCVCIMRMPFTHPEDIFVKAMKQKYINSGRSDFDFFTEYDLPQMLLKLRQGFGRLIRHEADTGIIAVLDNRFMKKKYRTSVSDILREYECYDDLEEAISHLPEIDNPRAGQIADLIF